jgi:hypothetical protein
METRMRILCWTAVLPFVAVFAAGLFAADLTKVARRIAKEPTCQGKAKYCLLVFGPEAKTRVWLVQDGSALYIDRNADGDLTGPGEKVEHDQKHPTSGEELFHAGDLREGDLLHQGLMVYARRLDQFADGDDNVAEYVAKDPKARGYLVSLNVEMPEFRGGGGARRVRQATDAFYDISGFLAFAEKPEDAPIIHFRGPRKATLYSRQRLTIGRETDLDVGVGTPGLGPGTTAWTSHDDVVPKQGFLTADVLYSPVQVGQAPTRELYELKKRC